MVDIKELSKFMEELGFVPCEDEDEYMNFVGKYKGNILCKYEEDEDDCDCIFNCIFPYIEFNKTRGDDRLEVEGYLKITDEWGDELEPRIESRLYLKCSRDIIKAFDIIKKIEKKLKSKFPNLIIEEESLLEEEIDEPKVIASTTFDLKE